MESTFRIQSSFPAHVLQLQICDLDDDQASIGPPVRASSFSQCSSWLLLVAFVGGQRQATENKEVKSTDDQQSPINATCVCQKASCRSRTSYARAQGPVAF
jgi:hypothetical protein